MISPAMLRPATLYVAWLALFCVIFLKSWVCEDAYITFRVIDNFVHGYGLRWNVNERVQVYTHPLWLLLHLPFAPLWDNLFHLNIALSVMCSSLAVAIALLTFRKSLAVTLVCFVIPLFLSKAFLDYTSSGLETSLSFLLFAILGYVVVHGQERPWFPFTLSLTASLLLLNRLDHIILIAPLLAWLAVQHAARVKTPGGVAMLVAGALPLVAWFSFSLIYYGFLFPNTKYAKLDTGFPLSDYLLQGAHYAFIWITHDTASVLVMLAALLLTFRHTLRTPLLATIATGIVLNYCYVLYIGGDYMMGRFYAVIFFASSWLLLAIAPDTARDDILFSAIIALFLAFAASHLMLKIREECEACLPVKGRVIDASRIFGSNGLFRSYWPPNMRAEGQYKFAKDGKDMAKEVLPPIKPLRYIGMAPYYAGARGIFVDELALTDAFLARLPAQSTRAFYVGHYKRRIPKGYMDAVQYGITSGMHPSIRRYYEKLTLITQGDVWDKERIITIIRFNFGQYEHYKLAYFRPSR